MTMGVEAWLSVQDFDEVLKGAIIEQRQLRGEVQIGNLKSSSGAELEVETVLEVASFRRKANCRSSNTCEFPFPE